MPLRDRKYAFPWHKLKRSSFVEHLCNLDTWRAVANNSIFR